MRMGQGVRTGLGHGGITCVLQTQFSSYFMYLYIYLFYLSMKIRLDVSRESSAQQRNIKIFFSEKQ